MKNWERISNDICQRADEKARRVVEVTKGLAAIYTKHKFRTDEPFVFETNNNKYLLVKDGDAAKIQIWLYDGHESCWLDVDWETTEKLYNYLCE